MPRFIRFFAATKPRFSRFSPRQCRDFYDFDRDNAAIFGILACRGTAIFGLKNRDKFLPLVYVVGTWQALAYIQSIF